MLSPSEIESLFGGLDLSRTTALNSLDKTDTNQTLAAGQFALPLSLVESDRAHLHAWHAECVERWKQTWPESIRHRWSIGSVSIDVQRLRDFFSTIDGWRAFQVSSESADQAHWIVLDDGLIAAHLDCVLGASDLEPSSDRCQTWGPLEAQLTNRLVADISHSLFPSPAASSNPAWQIAPIDPATDWLSRVPVFLSAEIVQFHLEVNCSGSTGRVRLAIPRSIANTLRATSGTTPASSSSKVVELRATLLPIALSRSELNQLQIGDVILTGQPGEATCLVQVTGQRTFEASIGSHQDHKAVRLRPAIDSVPATS
jgi:flagellar motor switch protein FliM